MKKRILFNVISSKLSFIVMALSLMVLFSGPLNPAQADDEYLYGSIMPVTGPIPQYGEYFIRGSELAMEDIKKGGWINGKKIRIILEDGKAAPKISLAAMNKLIDIDKVPIVESLVTPVILSIGPLAQKNKVVLVNTAAQSPQVGKLGDYIFSLNPLADRVMNITGEYAAKGLKAKTAAILHVNSEYGRSVAEAFKNAFAKYGGKVVATEIINMGETDFTTPLTKIKYVKADVIFSVAHEAELGYALKKARQIGIKTPFLSAPRCIAPMTYKIAGKAIEGVTAPDYIYDPHNGTPLMKAFGERYKKSFGIYPHTYPAYSYDSVMLYATALKNGAKTPEQIKDFYYKLKNYEGVSGPIAFDKNGITLADPVIRIVRNGRAVNLKWKK